MARQAGDDFLMPRVYIGQIVCWYEGGSKGREPQAAIVTATHQRSLNLNIFDQRSYNMRVRDGVRHLNDPDARDSEKIEVGLWDFTARDKDINKVIREFDELSKTVLEDIQAIKDDNQMIQELALEKINTFSEQLRQTAGAK